jgi:hypothetical protein
LFEEDSILFLQILDDGLLVTVDPAGDHKKEDLDFSIHPSQENDPLRAAQAATSLQPDSLALQAFFICGTNGKRGECCRIDPLARIRQTSLGASGDRYD